MGVKMFRNLPHSPVDAANFWSKSLSSGCFQTFKHPFNVFLRGVRSMRFPDDHGGRTGFTIGHPTNVVFVVPVRKSCRFAQLAIINNPGHHGELISTGIESRTVRGHQFTYPISSMTIKKLADNR